MPRPKGEPTKVVRLPVALLEQAEAEAARTKRTLAEVFAAGLDAPQPRRSLSPVAAPRRGTAPLTSAVGITSRAPTDDGRNEYGHLFYCKCPVCKPIPKGGKR